MRKPFVEKIGVGLGELLAKPGARPVRACPTGRHHASAVALHAEAVRAVGSVGVGGDIAERPKDVEPPYGLSLP